MRARQITLGVVSYLGGAAALLVVSLAISKTGLLQAISTGDAVVLFTGALLIGLAALGLQKLEVRRPTPKTGEEGGRPEAGAHFPADDFSWSSLTAIFGAAVALAIVPRAEASQDDPVHPARGTFENLLLDGDRDGTSVTLRHQHIDERWTGQGEPCARCHHMNLPGEDATPCSECHSSMSRPNDIFDHDLHAEAEGGNAGCQNCHLDSNEPRERETMRLACADCHTDAGRRAMQRMVPDGASIEMEQGLAPSYVNAMHGLCMDCHRTISEEHARCTVCHRSGGIHDGQAEPGQH